MAKHPLHEVAIVGIHNTKQGRSLAQEGWSSETLMLEAVRGVLADSGLTRKDIDGVKANGGSLGGEQVAYLMGINPAYSEGSAGGIPSVLEAAHNIAAGEAHPILITVGQAAAYSERGSTAPWTRPNNEFIACWGMFTAAEFALVARRHMHEFGTKPEALAAVAASIRNKGHINPEAIYYGRGPYTPKDILESRMVADPYHLLDCSMTAEGASAMIITTVERARTMKQKPIYILGGCNETTGTHYRHPPSYNTVGMVGAGSAEKMFAQSGLAPKDVDVCEFYDPFSWEIIRQFEAYGFCNVGEGGDFVMGGTCDLDGRFPVETDGGLMSYSHAGSPQLLQRVIEGVIQLRGTGGMHQVKGAKIALCTNFGAGAGHMATMLLGTEPAA